MPHLRIFGLPDGFKQDDISGLTDGLREALANMPALGITREDIFIFYPEDCRRRIFTVGDVIVCDAVLFDTPGRTPEVRKEFAEKVTETIQNFFPDSMVKCMAFPFDRAWGYSTRDPKKKRRG